MLGIGGRTTVPAREDLAVGEQAFHHDLRGAGNRPGERVVCLQFQLSAVVELAADARQKVYAVLGRLGNDGFHTILILP